MQDYLNWDAALSLLTLSLMEIVLGIDNIVFISILTGKLPREQQGKGRRLGLTLALFIRLGLLAAIQWIMGLTAPLFTVFGWTFTGQKLILFGGGLFLMGKATHEIHDKLEGSHGEAGATAKASRFGLVIAQILALDIVFSLDSVITAVGMAQHFAVMATAMVIAVIVMLIFAGAIGDFVNRHPSMKMLALSFLLLIGVMLVAEGLGKHIEKGYIYFAMAFSLAVELLNMWMRKKSAPVHLHSAYETRAVRPS
jgi:predicted tellurium resistance membrane protein TerC